MKFKARDYSWSKLWLEWNVCHAFENARPIERLEDVDFIGRKN
jgi:hypothetical protein